MTHSDNMELWGQLCRPPAGALKTIQAGRLKGKSDISPQWRLRVMTETFGPVGIGWRYYIERLWTEPGPNDQVFAFATVNVQIKQGDEWSEQIPGIGGHMLVVNERSGAYANDEAYKMAVTDALSVALKSLGVAADIYEGKFDGSKYTDGNQPSKPAQSHEKPPESEAKPTDGQQTKEWDALAKRMSEAGQSIPEEKKKAFRKEYDLIKQSHDVGELKNLVGRMEEAATDTEVAQL